MVTFDPGAVTSVTTYPAENVAEVTLGHGKPPVDEAGTEPLMASVLDEPLVQVAGTSTAPAGATVIVQATPSTEAVIRAPPLGI